MCGIRQKVIFKESKAGLNSAISFPWTSFLTKKKKKEPNLPIYILMYAFSKRIIAKRNAVSNRHWTLVIDYITFNDNHDFYAAI